MTSAELTEQHFRIMAQLKGHGRVAVYPEWAVKPLRELAALKMVEWDVSERPIGPGGVLGQGWAMLLPDGASAVADHYELKYGAKLRRGEPRP